MKKNVRVSSEGTRGPIGKRHGPGGPADKAAFYSSNGPERRRNRVRRGLYGYFFLISMIGYF